MIRFAEPRQVFLSRPQPLYQVAGLSLTAIPYWFRIFGLGRGYLNVSRDVKTGGRSRREGGKKRHVHHPKEAKTRGREEDEVKTTFWRYSGKTRGWIG